MRQSIVSPSSRRAWRFAVVALLALSVTSLAACKSRDGAITEQSSSKVETGTVQATPEVTPTVAATAAPAPSEVLTSAPATSTVATTAPASKPATSAAKPKPKPAAAKPAWPAKVTAFAKSFKKPVWYPQAVPKGFKTDSVDVVEMDPGTGLVCDVVLLRDGKVIQFTQGSPTVRAYEFVSAGKVPWGAKGKADIVRQDPADPKSPIIIVFQKDGNLAELSGDVSPEALKAIAASMVLVK